MAEPLPPDAPTNGPSSIAPSSAAADPPPPGPTSKRQRRPSVRLGEIGEPPAAIPHEPLPRRPKHWPLPSKPSSKTRPATIPFDDLDDDHNPPETLTLAFKKGLRDGKARRGPPALLRRARSNWISRPDDVVDTGDLKSSGGEDVGDDGFRDDSENRDVAAADGDEPSETDGADWNENRNGLCRSNEDGGVRSWLERLGLGRYAPVFEIHEVDDEVLPLLTLEDLKDMGINAVGSRRKMHCAIQKLRKGFT
ncbi:hypothetical protein J5N97_021526 [Dioscorea zingiberensis]|uniref:SAM domain-containing protein n=1 Tax=Dioscorea zingiberensis TaxID=325984 RepID=A0A9D5CHV0_9LILI|nr:hypothetical protein J5N97_021526 [Dioscorea zingiberensis]